MSVVVACKFKNGVVMASDRRVSRYLEGIDDKINKSMKIENKNMLIGGVGYLKDLQNMFFISNELFKEVIEANEKQLLKALYTKLTPLYRDNMFIEANQVAKFNSQFIVADPYHINLLSGDLSLIPDFDYYAIGCGEDLVMGHLNVEFKNKKPETMEQKDIIKILKDSIKVACKDSLGIDDNVDIYVAYKHAEDLVSDNSYEVIEKCEYKIVGKEVPKKECNGKCKECIHNMRFIWSKNNKTIQMISN